MKEVYECYTKEIAGERFFFVKRYTIFPELSGVAPILEGFGMHKNFNKACAIAYVHDFQIREQLFTQATGETLQYSTDDMPAEKSEVPYLPTVLSKLSRQVRLLTDKTVVPVLTPFFLIINKFRWDRTINS